MVSNYRPISILLVVSKVTEKWVAEQFKNYLNLGHTPLHPMQFGFRTNHSTETANCFLLENIKLKLDKGGIVGAVFLDLKKAFDTVNHQILLSKLSSYNFSDEAMKWMESYLTNRKQCVHIGNSYSSYLDCNIGVPQGSVLGPILFSLYINTSLQFVNLLIYNIQCMHTILYNILYYA